MAAERLMVSVSGVRGTIGETLTPQVAMEFGLAFAAMLGAGRKVAMGRDTRRSGEMIAAALSAGLLAGGVDVIDLGVVTTPGAALMTRRLACDGGVIVTASHNPPKYNGIKFLQPIGVGLTFDGAAELKRLWESRKFALMPTERVGRASRDDRTHDEHLAAVCEVCDVPAVAARRFKVVLDCINGAGCIVTPRLLECLGCEMILLNGEPTGEFAHTPEPIEENLTGLCRAVREHGADVGFAQDPDADRLVVVAEGGKFIGEEYTLALAAAFVLRHRKGKLATNLATSRMIDDVAAAAGAEVVRAPTGEANVVEAMLREGCFFAGEGNGGVIEPRVVPVRNSLVGMAYLLQYMAETGKPLGALAAEIPAYVMLKTKFPAPAGVAPRVAAETKKHFAARGGSRFDERDGLRVDLPAGWVSVRASNTEPIMRIMAEARDRAAAEALVAETRKLADAVIGKQ
ncbi:MAG TPA: phosphoglucosamine mutase [Phycisphaerales bacterium]|nr:phosphoglucosamine mutase [Phycisphaerales bacterium]